MEEHKPLSVLYIGTSGWSYKHWAGIFYPDTIKSNRYLEYYIKQFGCVELNSSFYHLPKKDTIKGWIERTPADFKFCPKLSRFITHRLHLLNSEESLRKFFDLFDEMRSRLGPILIQLPPGLLYKRSLIVDFFNILKEQYEGYRFAIEVRHKSWINDEFLTILNQYGIAFVIADSGKRYPYFEAVTTDFVYIRFHGHEALYASDYREQELQAYAYKIMSWKSANKDVWVFFNNDFNGFAVKNAKRLREIIQSIPQ